MKLKKLSKFNYDNFYFIVFIYTISELTPPFLFALIYNDIYPILIFICPLFKEYFFIIFGAILSHRTKEFNQMLTNIFFKISTKPAKKLIKHTVQFQFE